MITFEWENKTSHTQKNDIGMCLFPVKLTSRKIQNSITLLKLVTTDPRGHEMLPSILTAVLRPEGEVSGEQHRRQRKGQSEPSKGKCPELPRNKRMSGKLET